MEEQVLYHYTSFDAFVNIIKEKKFRLFDITKSNDPLEGVYLMQELEKSYIRLYQNDELTKDEYMLAHKAFFYFKENMFSEGRPVDFYAAASFCIPEHELLMLRSYADNGKGVAMGVPISTLKNLSSRLDKVEFKKIEYLSAEEIKAQSDSFWKDNIKRFKSLLKYEDEEKLAPFIEKIKEYYQSGYFIKDEINKDENEYRILYYYDNLFERCPPGLGCEVPQEIEFSNGSDGIKVYYKIPVGTDQNDLFYFSDIIGGPLCGVTINEMNTFLRRYGFFKCNINKNSWVKMR